MVALAIVKRIGGVVTDEELRRVTSILFLAAAAAVLCYTVYWTATALFQPVAAKCTNPPSRTTSVPQLVEVLACFASYVLGRLTARPKLRTRVDVMNRTASTL